MCGRHGAVELLWARRRDRSDVFAGLPAAVLAVGGVVVHAEAGERAAAGAVEAEAVQALPGAGVVLGDHGRRVVAHQEQTHKGQAQQRHAQLAGLEHHCLCGCSGCLLFLWLGDGGGGGGRGRRSFIAGERRSERWTGEFSGSAPAVLYV
jgi:hypothetical protein